MTTTSPLQPGVNSQYDPDSAPNQPFNCGPTTVTNALRFHQDRDYPIEATRNLATSADGRGTTAAQRKVMFDRRGTSAEVIHLSHAQVKATLNGRRAMDIALLMGKIPLAIRKRPFSGSHSVEGLAVGSAKCPVHQTIEPGIWVNNPDHHVSRGEPARYFYPDHAWIPAYDALGGWCVRPMKEKVIVTRVPYKKTCVVTASPSLRARSGPGTNFTVVKSLSKGFRFTSAQLEKAGGAYTVGSTTRRDWLSFVLNGKTVWVARGYVKEV